LESGREDEEQDQDLQREACLILLMPEVALLEELQMEVTRLSH
jgi:hypothetical protein